MSEVGVAGTFETRAETWAWHLLGFVLPVVTFAGILVGSYWVLSGIILGLVIYPVLEIFTKDAAPDRSEVRPGGVWDAILLFHTVFTFAILGCLFWRASVDGPNWTTWVAAISTALTSGASGIITAHELGHRRKHSFLWWVARLNLLAVLYLHFTTEHNHGHHRNYATDIDPVSAPKERGLWTHIVQAIPRQVVSAWKTHSARGRVGFRNPILHGFIIEAVTILLVWVLFGKWVTLAFLAQAGVAIILLEYINYIQHYGLRRGVGEKHSKMHSWESRNILSRWTLLELPLHPAHHLKASDPIWLLEAHEGSNQLPTGYYGCLWPCLIPPIWKRMMRSRLPE